MANGWLNNGNNEKLYFGGLQNHCRWCLQPRNYKTLAPWKESYDQPRQHVKKQRHYFAEKGLSGQSYGFPVVVYGCASWTIKLSTEELMLLNHAVGEDSWESLGLQGDQTSQL